MKSPWLFLIVVAACNSGSATPPKPAPASPPRDARGVDADPSKLPVKTMYLTLCSPCHGADAKGYAADHAPSLISRTFLESATDEFLKTSIARGRPGTSMGAYGKEAGGPLDGEAVDKLVAYLRGQGPASLAALPPAGTGDPAKGAIVYGASCKVCHGDPKIRGEAIQLSNVQLLAQASDNFLRYAIVNGRPGTKMEPFTGKLTEQQIDDVVAYVRQLGAGGGAPVHLLPEPTGKEPLIINPKGKDPAWKVKEDRFVSVEDVNRALAAKRRMVIIDARPPSEWMRVHVAGAVSIPYHSMARLKDIPKDVDVVAYCACPHHLSGIVVDELRKQGHARSFVLDEGINEWHRRGYPVTAAEGVEKPAEEPQLPAGTIR